MTGEAPEAGRKREGPWGTGATLGFGALIVFAMFCVHLVVAAVFVVVQLVLEPDSDPNELVATLETSGLVLAVASLGTAFLCVPLILLLVHLRRGPSIATYLGLERPRPRTLLVWLAVAGAAILLSDGLTSILGRPIVPDVMVRIYRDTVALPLLWTALVIAAPLYEEMLFRGFLLEGLRRSALGSIGAVILTSFAWAMIHLQYAPYELATILVLGMVLGAARLRSGSLVVPILMHGVFNLVATIQTALLVAGS